ncbi:hypothetical protein ACFTWH_09040 [Streptomyces sp. NPDC057011]|uniref:hypothetical protein n=1 Tax=unclassified Streptomyces TaxID=2593676 RepID=UPI003637C01A
MKYWTPHLPRRGGARKATLALAAVIAVCALLAGFRWWSAEQRGVLAVVVKELPSGAAADVLVQGPDGFERRITASRTFDKVAPGQYTLTVNPSRGRDADIHPTKDRLTASVRRGSTTNAEAVYANVVPHTTKVLDAARLELAGPVTDGGRLVFAQAAGQAGNLAPGDVVVAGIGPHTPYGLMRRVTAVHRDDSGQLVVDTGPATLRDALPKARIDVRNLYPVPGAVQSPAHSMQAAAHPPLRASQASFPSAGGRGLPARPAAPPEEGSVQTGGDGTFSILSPLGKNAEAPVGGGKLSAECALAVTQPLKPVEEVTFIGVKPHIEELYADWGLTGIDGARFSIGVEEKAQIKISPPAVEVKKCDWRWQFPADPVEVAVFTIPVGPVPVVVACSVSLVGSLGAGGKTDLSLDFTQEAQVVAGMAWQGGRASPIASFKNDFRLNKGPSITTELTAKAGVRLQLEFYGVDGPWVDLTPGVKAAEEDKLGVSSERVIKGGLYTSAGISFKPWGLEGLSAEISDLYHVETVLYSPNSPNSPTTGASPTPAPSGPSSSPSQSSSPKPDPAKEAPCPSDEVIRTGVKKLFTSPGAPGSPHLGKPKCWNGWVAAVWSEEPASDFVTISVFTRSQDKLTSAVNLLPVMDDSSDPDFLRDCSKLRGLRPPAGLIDFVGCPG